MPVATRVCVPKDCQRVVGNRRSFGRGGSPRASTKRCRPAALGALGALPCCWPVLILRGSRRRMLDRTKTLKLTAATLLLFVAFTQALAADDKKKEKAEHAATPVLWRGPDDITARDLFNGPGGEEMRPDLRRVTFLKEETGG